MTFRDLSFNVIVRIVRMFIDTWGSDHSCDANRTADDFLPISLFLVYLSPHLRHDAETLLLFLTLHPTHTSFCPITNCRVLVIQPSNSDRDDFSTFYSLSFLLLATVHLYSHNHHDHELLCEHHSIALHHFPQQAN